MKIKKELTQEVSTCTEEAWIKLIENWKVGETLTLEKISMIMNGYLDRNSLINRLVRRLDNGKGGYEICREGQVFYYYPHDTVSRNKLGIKYRVNYNYRDIRFMNENNPYEFVTINRKTFELTRLE